MGVVFSSYVYGKEREARMTCRKIQNKLRILLILLQILVAIGAILLFLPAIFRIYPNIVLSGSMEPEIPTGSLAYVYAGYPIERIHSEDVVEYELQNGTEILHRVVEVNETEQSFKTKGDANVREDLGVVDFEQYRGKLIATVPYVGYVVSFLGNKYVIVGILCVCMAYLLTDIVRDVCTKK